MLFACDVRRAVQATLPHCAFLSRRRLLLLHVAWDVLRRSMARGALTTLFYECLRAESKPIHDFIAPVLRERAQRVDAFRQLLGQLCEHVASFAPHSTSLHILFDTLLGVASTQYSVSLFDTAGRAAVQCVTRALGSAGGSATMTSSLQIALARLFIALARAADVSVDDDDLYRSASALMAAQQRDNDGGDDNDSHDDENNDDDDDDIAADVDDVDDDDDNDNNLGSSVKRHQPLLTNEKRRQRAFNRARKAHRRCVKKIFVVRYL